jgi:YHS domain-containing protein
MRTTLSLLGAVIIVSFSLAAGKVALACDKNKDPAHQCAKDCDCAKHSEAQKAEAKAPVAFDKAPAVGTKATCPVTGEQFEVKADTARSEYKGKHYVFCCPGCKPKFDADPEKYLKK